VGAIACLLELFDHANDNFIVDALGVNLCRAGLAAWRRWRGVCHPTGAFGSLLIEAQCGGA
jgi:hypothetical protein